MSRWKSPQTAARQAERKAKETDRLVKEKRKQGLFLGGLIFLMLTIWTSYFVFYAIPRLSKPHRHQHRTRMQTNNLNEPVQNQPK